MEPGISRLDYAGKDVAIVGVADPLIVGSAADVMEDAPGTATRR